MSVTFHLAATLLDAETDTWDMHRGTPTLNVSNHNANLILERLGLSLEAWGEIDPDDLLGRALVGNVGRDDTGTAPVEHTNGVIDCGLRAGYFEDRLAVLVTVARAAKAQGVNVQWD